VSLSSAVLGGMPVEPDVVHDDSLSLEGGQQEEGQHIHYDSQHCSSTQEGRGLYDPPHCREAALLEMLLLHGGGRTMS
jgi:hypothetical protein